MFQFALDVQKSRVEFERFFESGIMNICLLRCINTC